MKDINEAYRNYDRIARDIRDLIMKERDPYSLENPARLGDAVWTRALAIEKLAQDLVQAAGEIVEARRKDSNE